MIEQYYTFYPVKVFGDKAVTAGARLLYGVIFTCALKTGYCDATNQELGDSICISPKRASVFVSELVRHNYLRREEWSRNERRLYPLVK